MRTSGRLTVRRRRLRSRRTPAVEFPCLLRVRSTIGSALELPLHYLPQHTCLLGVEAASLCAFREPNILYEIERSIRVGPA